MTSTALLETLTVYPKGQVIASGGIRNSLDIVKALSLGASAVGMAGRLLHILKTRGTSSLIQYIEELEEGIKLVMTALVAKNIPALTEVPLVISGGTAEWCKARGIDFVSYARRGN